MFAEITSTSAWYKAPRTFGDVWRCRFGRHVAHTQVVHDGTLVWRCSCGAFNFNQTGWFYEERPIGRRKGTR